MTGALMTKHLCVCVCVCVCMCLCVRVYSRTVHVCVFR